MRAERRRGIHLPLDLGQQHLAPVEIDRLAGDRKLGRVRVVRRHLDFFATLTPRISLTAAHL
jgi:hypothetical protein